MGFDRVQRPLDVRRGSKTSGPSIRLEAERFFDITASTAPSTSLVPRGVLSLATTSTTTGAPVVYDLAQQERGDVIEIAVASLASSSEAPFHINAASGVTFDGSTDDMLLLSTAGAAVRLLALSTTQWAAMGTRGATFSTST